MVRFSCFNTNMHSEKPKKSAFLSMESNHNESQAMKDFIDISSRKLSHLKIQGHTEGSTSNVISPISAYSADDGCNFSEAEKEARKIKKSMSLGSGLDREGQTSTFNESNVFDDDEEEEGEEVAPSHSPQGSSQVVNHESIFSFGDLQQHKDTVFTIEDPNEQSEKEGRENSDTHVSGEGKSHAHVMVKSRSLPNISLNDGRRMYNCDHSRSAEDLTVLDLRRKDIVAHEVELAGHEQGRDHNNEEFGEDGYDSYNYAGDAKDWVVPIMEEEEVFLEENEETSAHQWEESPGKEFKTKRIEDWVSRLSSCGNLVEAEDDDDHLSNVVDESQMSKDVATPADNLTVMKLESTTDPGMEAAKRYISSLRPNTSAAQLANLGLVMMPFLSAFCSLRAVNLSGNAIVRITAGSLPRGLHFLNLSKNNISGIEGLRELTRLRVLDLSYNRVFRIGHGLASCGSLKELYLAGNKISEIEGLHRLLKLNVLDIRFNKISTAKSLGQLAANYNSLQAISLEGNPAQKNIGDEQLKKYLQGLLPHLAYYNRQSIKDRSSKDKSDRSTRLAISSDRGHRTDHHHKSLRKGAHSSSTHRAPSSNHGGHRSQAAVSPKVSKNRHLRLPPAPAGTKTIQHQQFPYHDIGSKILSLRSDLSMKRSMSEGTLAPH
ncbi:uncharacterized protein LOC124922146 [Impatiens glandulifera]|uniref:uncharacterized protein LOC124922146 n=1 Tax=Impatiens glandulifera TaxID=253017 RepID=UPI001FB0A862|nr:uncharacterized protein LOC124922146 [Impatiens glandulifera]XP_047318831.1 uncharacterized protein LOC124922146 [Impatiens glandulifera]